MSYNNYLSSLILLKMINSMQSTRRGVILKRGAILEQAGEACSFLSKGQNKG